MIGCGAGFESTTFRLWSWRTYLAAWPVPEIHKWRSDKSIRLTRYATTDIFDKFYNGVEREEIKQDAHKLTEVFTFIKKKAV